MRTFTSFGFIDHQIGREPLPISSTIFEDKYLLTANKLSVFQLGCEHVESRR